LASRRLISVINTFAKGKLEVTMENKKYGMAVMEYMSPFGNLTFAIHEQFTKDWKPGQWWNYIRPRPGPYARS